MGDIVQKMLNHMPEAFMRLSIFLPALVTPTAVESAATVEAGVFFPEFFVRHR